MEKTYSLKELRDLLLSLDGGAADGTQNGAPATIRDAKEAAIDALATHGAADTAEEAARSAGRVTEEGERATAAAREKSDALAAVLSDFVAARDADYEALTDAIRAGYESDDASRAVLDRYAEAGRRAAGHAVAEAAGANGGSADSYAAAQGNRQIQDYLAAGESAAQKLYGEKLDRLLDAVRARSADIGDLLGTEQKNADGDADRGHDALTRGYGMFADLLDAENDRARAASDALKVLTGEAVKEDYTAGEASPMEIDAAFRLLTEEQGLSREDALIALWRQYPSMQQYLLDTYTDSGSVGFR